MTLQNAINVAYENGYGANTFTNFVRVPNEITGIDVALDSIFLDVLFWQCLGKAMGWADPMAECFCEIDAIRLDCKKWIHQWMGLIYYTADGGTIQNYFNKYD